MLTRSSAYNAPRNDPGLLAHALSFFPASAPSGSSASPSRLTSRGASSRAISAPSSIPLSSAVSPSSIGRSIFSSRSPFNIHPRLHPSVATEFRAADLNIAGYHHMYCRYLYVYVLPDVISDSLLRHFCSSVSLLSFTQSRQHYSTYSTKSKVHFHLSITGVFLYNGFYVQIRKENIYYEWFIIWQNIPHNNMG